MRSTAFQWSKCLFAQVRSRILQLSDILELSFGGQRSLLTGNPYGWAICWIRGRPHCKENPAVLPTRTVSSFKLIPKISISGIPGVGRIPITSMTEFSSIRQNSDPKRKLRCGGDECGNPSGKFSEAASLYFQLDSESERGKPYGFSISCSNTESCAAMIPIKK